MWYYIIRFALHIRLHTDAGNNHKLFNFFLEKIINQVEEKRQTHTKCLDSYNYIQVKYPFIIMYGRIS
jgi:hypothetical protein